MLSLFSLPKLSGPSTSSCSCFTSDLFVAPFGCLQNLVSSSHCVNLYYPFFFAQECACFHSPHDFFQLLDAAAAIIPSNYAPYQLSWEAVCCCAPSLVSSGNCCVSFLHIPIQESSSSTALISVSCSLFCYFYHPTSLCRCEETLR